ncbi:MAG: PrsW family intramembrane metalloprotease [Oscillospiraceae bacterium]|nr:PrsW family intramembrane metalloprotease [Oscillospiraceae bacterium]
MQTILILAAIAPAAVLLILVYRADRLEKEPFSLLISLVLLGIPITIVAAVVEQIGDMFLSSWSSPGSVVYDVLMYFGVVAMTEEAVKYLLLRWRTWNNRNFNCSFDGVVYAVFVSLGFALWENIAYVLQFGLGNALARALTAVPGHACFGVFMGTWYGMAKRSSLLGREDQSYRERWLSFLIPSLLHGAYDYIAITRMEELWWLFLLFIAALFIISIRLVKKLSKEDGYMVRPGYPQSATPGDGAYPYRYQPPYQPGRGGMGPSDPNWKNTDWDDIDWGSSSGDGQY